MRLHRVPDDPVPSDPPHVVATIGSFDGVHRGHRLVIGRAIQRAAELGAQCAVVTFDPHPRSVIRPDAPLHLLSALDEKIALIEDMGVEHCLVWRFDPSVRDLSPEAFIALLNERVRLRALIHGPGFALGRARSGTPALLAKIGAQAGFSVEAAAVAPAHFGLLSAPPPGEVIPAPVVSSTAIRKLVLSGQVQAAERALGRLPTLLGTVVHGEHMGRQLGFPTANLDLQGPLAVPDDGVYAAWADVEPFTGATRRYAAAVSIGTRPQFGGLRRVIEAYLLDFSGDLYGKRLRLHFTARLRGQRTFTGVEALVAQIGEDVRCVCELLTETRQWRTDELLAAADG